MSLCGDDDCVPGRGRRFALKNLAAEEWTLTIHHELATLDDPRLHTQRQLRVPMAVQRFAAHGRSHSDQTDGSLYLQYMLPDCPTDYLPIVWLLWMRNEDLHDPARNTVFLVSERERKQQLYEAHGWDFKPITIERYCRGVLPKPTPPDNRRTLDKTGHDGE